MSETTILEGLLATLKALELDIAMAWPNTPFKPPLDTDKKPLPFARAYGLPAQPFAPGLGHDSANEHRGIFQVSVFWPQGQGITAPMQMASEIAAGFRRGTAIARDDVTILITQPPAVGPALQEEVYLQIPVSVPYLAIIPNL